MKKTQSDPLYKQGTETQSDLFDQFVKASAGFQNDDVVGAAINLLINAMRQTHPTRDSAEKAFDEIIGKSKGLLLDGHYDSITKKRRNIFPFHQVIELPFPIVMKKK